MLLGIRGAWCKSPNNRIISYKNALHRTGCERIETTVRTMRLLWSGSLLRIIGDHRLPMRIMSGELETTGKRGPAGKKKEGTECGRALSNVLHPGGLKPHRTGSWGLVQRSVCERRLYVYGRVSEGRVKGVRKLAEEETSGRGEQR